MDKDHIPQLIQLGSTATGVQAAQARAKQDMADNGYGATLHNACAATLSEFLKMSNINVPITLGAGNLARRIKNRGWDMIDVGYQTAGDVAVAENNVHIFFVVKTVDHDEMIIADNQAPGPHYRKASGDPDLNHSPVAYFLRAQAATSQFSTKEIVVDTTAPDSRVFPQGDEETSNNLEPFKDDGTPNK